jgi:hypothetical protein
MLVATGLIGMDYHFVSDVLAGGFIGATVGTYTAYLGGLRLGQRATAHQEGPGGPRRGGDMG